MQKVLLNNGYSLPVMATGTNRMDYNQLIGIIDGALENDVIHFDSARDYGNEAIVGDALSYVSNRRNVSHSDFFITTKVGNGQQERKDMKRELDQSLQNLKVEYLDLWLLHWPLPDYYIENMVQMNNLMKTGKVKAIGLANPRVRHLEMLKREAGIVPQVIQIEHHPFRLSRDLLDYCRENRIVVQAYSPLCFMIDKLKNNSVLMQLASKYNKNIGQIVLRWHYQHGVIPVFRTTNPKRYKENANIFDFTLDESDMQKIYDLDEDFKFIPESLHCYGY